MLLFLCSPTVSIGAASSFIGFCIRNNYRLGAVKVTMRNPHMIPTAACIVIAHVDARTHSTQHTAHAAHAAHAAHTTYSTRSTHDTRNTRHKILCKSLNVWRCSQSPLCQQTVWWLTWFEWSLLFSQGTGTMNCLLYHRTAMQWLLCATGNVACVYAIGTNDCRQGCYRRHGVHT